MTDCPHCGARQRLSSEIEVAALKLAQSERRGIASMRAVLVPVLAACDEQAALIETQRRLLDVHRKLIDLARETLRDVIQGTGAQGAGSETIQ